MNKKKKIKFTLHAEDKLKRLMRIGVTKEKILEIIEKPEKVVNGYSGRRIAPVSYTHLTLPTKA